MECIKSSFCTGPHDRFCRHQPQRTELPQLAAESHSWHPDQQLEKRVRTTTSAQSPARPALRVYPNILFSLSTPPVATSGALSTYQLQLTVVRIGYGLQLEYYFRVLTYSAIALACSSVRLEIPLLCGGLLAGSPFSRCSVI